MSRWATGADRVSSMITAGELERVAASQENPERLLAEAGRHLRSARLLAGEDPAGAYDLLYAAARKAMAAALAVQGLRATSRGGHDGRRHRGRPAQGRSDRGCHESPHPPRTAMVTTLPGACR